LGQIFIQYVQVSMTLLQLQFGW